MANEKNGITTAAIEEIISRNSTSWKVKSSEQKKNELEYFSYLVPNDSKSLDIIGVELRVIDAGIQVSFVDQTF